MQKRFILTCSILFLISPLAAQELVTAMASSGLAVHFESPSIVSISDNVATILQVGSVTISADQYGDANFNPAFHVTQSSQIEKASPVVKADNKTKLVGEPPLAFTISGDGFVGSDLPLHQLLKFHY